MNMNKVLVDNNWFDMVDNNNNNNNNNKNHNNKNHNNKNKNKNKGTESYRGKIPGNIRITELQKIVLLGTTDMLPSSNPADLWLP